MSKYKQIKTLIIDETKWANGSNKKVALLLTNSGNMCCLGFLSKACGFKNKQLLNEAFPISILIKDRSLSKFDFPKKVINSLGILSDWEIKASNINDSKIFSNVKRKSLLREHFKQIGIKLIFKRSK